MAPSENLGKAVVAVTEVLGIKAAEVLVTQSFTIRGTRVSRPAKHGYSPRQPLVINEKTVTNKNLYRYSLLRVREWQTIKQTSRLPKRLHSSQSILQCQCQTKRRFLLRQPTLWTVWQSPGQTTISDELSRYYFYHFFIPNFT